MNWPTDAELRYLIARGGMDAWVFQSEYQRGQWWSTLGQFGQFERSRVIRGAFDVEDFPLNPRDRGDGDPFVVGHLSRTDPTKFHAAMWEALGRVPNVRARVMGWNQRIERKIGPPPAWAEVLAPNAEPVREFLGSLHCLVHLHDEAVENWPRVGLEAMAAGVPVIADRRGGWCEMIEHGDSGYLVESVDEAAWYATLLARDRQERMRIVINARRRVEDLARPGPILAAWKDLFGDLGTRQCEKASAKA
jgi:glycosyltransferase involved in cell wall biosynthesis